MDFEGLLERIRSNEIVKPSELLPHLCLEERKERCHVNVRLAEAYSDIGNFRQARIFIQRSWMLSGFSPDILPLYINIHASLKDIDSIREAYKMQGMTEAARGNATNALRYFNQWQYAFVDHLRIDKYIYDFDILACIRRMAEPWRFREYVQEKPLSNRKIRLAYLMFGMLHSNSVLVKINCMLARYHDKERFDITFFVPDPKISIQKFEQAIETIDQLHGHHCDVILAPSSTNDLQRLRSLASKIFDYQPDILITSALLAEFEHYFIASLRPAPLIVGLIQGPPEQFAAPDMGWGISWSKHPLIDAPCDASLVHIGLDLPDRGSITPISKKELIIPDDVLIIMSGGRYVKFENLDFWKAVMDILSRHPDLYYVAVGVSREQLPFLDTLLTSDLSQRVMLLGWRKDVLNLFCLADVVIDTYPSGGGHVLIDAMALGIPIVSFENNYMRNFDQTDWSVADEFISIPELIVSRGDFEQFKNAVSRLIEDGGHRRRMGDLCKEQIRKKMGNPEKGVRDYEDVLTEIIKKKMKQKTSRGQETFTRKAVLGDKLRRMLSGVSRRYRTMRYHMKNLK
jgi:glycosyltransferase involved in cell wall biosynthesis